MRKTCLLVLLLSWLSAMGAWAEDYGVLYINQKNGEKVQCVIDREKPLVEFKDGKLVLYAWSDDEQAMQWKVELSRNEVESLTFGTISIDAIHPLKTDDGHIGFNLLRKGVVGVSGLKKADIVMVYHLDGRQVQVSVSKHEGTAEVDLNNEPRGVYMVSVNKRFTFKLMKP